MIVQLLVVLVVLIALVGFGPCPGSAHIDFTRMFRAHRTYRKHSLEIFTVALGAGRHVSLTDKLFEGLLAFSTGVFVNRHRERKDTVSGNTEATSCCRHGPN